MGWGHMTISGLSLIDNSRKLTDLGPVVRCATGERTLVEGATETGFDFGS